MVGCWNDPDPPLGMFASMIGNPNRKLDAMSNKMQKGEFKIKMGWVTALFAATLALAPAANAINLTIGNSVVNDIDILLNAGQSFINDPSGTGSTIKLNTWTFSFGDAPSRTEALSVVLSIYNGIGNGGTVVGTSSTTATSAFDFGNSVTWTFTGGLDITDNATYTAVLAPFLNYRLNGIGTDPNPAYPNGTLTSGTIPIANFDFVFEATFSEVPIPFEFEPSLGILLLGGAWAGNRALKRFRARGK